MPGRILVSACLVGAPVRYDGSDKALGHPLLERWRTQGRIVALCPELAGGFATPRRPAEIADGKSGDDVLAGTARVVDDEGRDVTAAMLAGAEAALETARANDCRFALLIDGSPSCGSAAIYDGSFGGRRHPGRGVTAALLARNGIAVFAPSEIADLKGALSASDGERQTSATGLHFALDRPHWPSLSRP